MSYIVVYATIESDDEETEISLIGHYRPGMPGNRDRYGVPIEPDDDPEMEIVSATNEAGEEIELNEAENARAMERLFESI